MRKEDTGVRPSFLYALSFVGFAICLASSLGVSLQFISTSAPFGLLGVLPPGFWVGMAVMLLSMALGVRSGSETLFFTQALLVFVALWGAPALFEKYPSVWDSYMHYSSALEIAKTGTVPVDPTFAYAYNYPGFFVLSASYILLGNAPALLFLQYYPVFVAVLTLASIYLFVRTYVPGLDYRLAFLAAAFANVWLQFNFSPQSMGLAAGLLIFVCLEREGTEWRMTALALFAFIVVSHPTTLVFVLGAILLKEVFGRLYRFFVARKRPMRLDRPWPVGAFILIWLGWFFTGASSFSLNLAQFLADRIQFLGFINKTVQNQIQLRTTPENILGAIYPQMRTATVVIFIAFTMIAFVTYLYLRRRSPTVFPKNILALFIIPFLIIPLDTLFFNGQLYDRGILYLVLIAPLIFVPLLMGRAGRWGRPALAAAICLLVVLCASTIYYQESLYVNNDEGIAASNYLMNQAPSTYVVGGYYPYNVWNNQVEDFHRLQFSSVWNESVDNITAAYGTGTYMFDHTTELWYRQWGITQTYQFYVDQAPQHYKVYDNGLYWVMYSPRG